MNIICCGAGTVGSQAAETLVAAGHDITVIDVQPDRLRALEENLEVKTLCGNCAHADILRQAGAEGADLVLGSTNVDEVNLLTASVAKGVGARKSIARVHRSAYFDNRGLNYCAHLGIDALICPEQSTAVAIASFLRNPGALFIENFAANQIQMQRLHVGRQAVGKSLAQLSLPQGLRVAAITRGGATSIPGADTVIEEGDLVTLVGNTALFETGRGLLASRGRRLRRVAIMGGSAIAVWLCRALEGKDFEIRLFEHNRARAEELARRLDNVTIIAADPTEPATFDDEHLESVDAFIGLVGDDEHNILACAWAKSRGVRQVITVVNRPNYVYLLAHLGIEHAVNPRLATAKEIENLLDVGPVRRAAVLAEGSIDVYQVRVGDRRDVIDRPLKDFQLAPAMMVAAIQRGDQTYVPGANDTFQPNDRLLVISTQAMEKKLRRIFAVE